MLRTFILSLVVAVGLGGAALAQSLDQLRASGGIGERFDGLVVARNPSLKGYADQVNRQRMEIYQQRAAEQGVSVSQVGQVYAQQIMRQAPAGTWFQNSSGGWRQ